MLLYLFRHGPFALALALLWHGVGQAVGLEGWAAHVARARRTSAVRPRSPSLVQPLLSASWLRVVEPRQNGAECRAPSWALVRRQPRRAHEQRGPHGRSQCRPAEGGLGPDREVPDDVRRHCLQRHRDALREQPVERAPRAGSLRGRPPGADPAALHLEPELLDRRLLPLPSSLHRAPVRLCRGQSPRWVFGPPAGRRVLQVHAIQWSCCLGGRPSWPVAEGMERCWSKDCIPVTTGGSARFTVGPAGCRAGGVPEGVQQGLQLGQQSALLEGQAPLLGPDVR